MHECVEEILKHPRSALEVGNAFDASRITMKAIVLRDLDSEKKWKFQFIRAFISPYP